MHTEYTNEDTKDINTRDDFEKHVEEEAQRIAYLQSLNLQEIADENIQKAVKELKDSTLNRQEKVHSIQRLVAESAIKTCLQKTKNLDDHQLNPVALKTLESLKSEEFLTADQIAQSKIAIATLEEDFTKIGKTHLGSSLKSLDSPDMTISEKLKKRMQDYAAQYLRKRSKDLINY